jgi:hypothetical protein
MLCAEDEEAAVGSATSTWVEAVVPGEGRAEEGVERESDVEDLLGIASVLPGLIGGGNGVDVLRVGEADPSICFLSAEAASCWLIIYVEPESSAEGPVVVDLIVNAETGVKEDVLIVACSPNVKAIGDEVGVGVEGKRG